MVFKLSWFPYIAIIGGIIVIVTEGDILWGAIMIILGVVLLPVLSGSKSNTNGASDMNNAEAPSSTLENTDDDTANTYTPEQSAPQPQQDAYDEAIDLQNHSEKQTRAKFCPHCGEKANEHYAFCIKCGNKLPSSLD